MPVLICLRKELWTGLISVGDQVPTCPVFTRAKIKSHLGILVNFPVTTCQHSNQKQYLSVERIVSWASIILGSILCIVSTFIFQEWTYFPYKSYRCVEDWLKVNFPQSTIWRHAWCYSYCCRKWNWQSKFKSWIRLFTFHFMLIPLQETWIYLFSLRLC